MLLLSLLKSPYELLAVVIGFLVIGITVHEFAHAYVAFRLGDPTAKMEGRVTLNPLAHLDPYGIIFFFIVGFGWGKPVPFNPRYLQKKSDELKIAVAGIVANLAVAAILGIPLRIALLQGHLIDSSIFLSVIDYIVVINLMLAVFNLLPIPPLDGSHFVEYFLDEEQKYKFQFYGQYALFGLIFYGILTGNSIIGTVLVPLIRVLHGLFVGTGGLFLG